MWQAVLAFYFLCFFAMLVLYMIERRNHRRSVACYESLLGNVQHELADLRLIERGLRMDLAGHVRKSAQDDLAISRLTMMIHRQNTDPAPPACIDPTA